MEILKMLFRTLILVGIGYLIGSVVGVAYAQRHGNDGVRRDGGHQGQRSMLPNSRHQLPQRVVEPRHNVLQSRHTERRFEYHVPPVYRYPIQLRQEYFFIHEYPRYRMLGYRLGFGFAVGYLGGFYTGCDFIYGCYTRRGVVYPWPVYSMPVNRCEATNFATIEELDACYVGAGARRITPPLYRAAPAQPPIYIERPTEVSPSTVVARPQGPCAEYETPEARDACRLRIEERE